MKKYLLLNLIVLSLIVRAQDSEINLDALNAPDSPAGNLLDIANSQIDRPTTPTGFMALINQSTSNFSSVPTQFAVDLAPWIILKGKKMTLDSYLGDNDVASNFKNTFVVSLATKFLDSLGEDNLGQVRRTAVGFKFAIKRGGKVDSDYLTQLSTIRKLRKDATAGELDDETINNLLNQDTGYLKVNELIAQTEAQIKNEVDVDEELRNFLNEMLKNLLAQKAKIEEQVSEGQSEKVNAKLELGETKSILENMKYQRYGFKMDFAAGMVFDFENNSFEQGAMTKGGAWLTAGYDYKEGFAWFLMARFLHNPALNYLDESGVFQTADVNNIDFGGKLVFDKPESKFSAGLEFLYRDYSEEEVEDGFRGTINFNYDIGTNNQFGITLGRNFDGTTSREGNVIAALNLLLGFNNKWKY